MSRLFSVLLIAFLLGSAGGGESWPEFRGPTGQGLSDSERLPRVRTLLTIWVTSTDR